MKKKSIKGFVFGTALAVSAGAIAADLCAVEKGGWRERAFAPTEHQGVYDPGETVTLKLVQDWTNGFTGTVEAKLSVIPFRSNKAIETRMESFAAALHATAQFKLTAPKRYGHYTVRANFSRTGEDCGYAETGFVVVPPMPAVRDPHWRVDKNCRFFESVEQLKRVGFGSFFALGASAGDVLGTTPAEAQAKMDAALKRFSRETRNKTYLHEGMAYAICFSPDIFRHPYVRKRIADSLPPLADDDLRRLRDYAKACAERIADLSDEWIVQMEYDGGGYAEKPDYLHLLELYTLVSRAIYTGVKAGNPKATVSVGGSNSQDYFWRSEKFQHSRLMFDAMRGFFDYVALDAYTGGYDGALARVNMPEDVYPQLLRDGAKLSKECGGQHKVVNAERCVGPSWDASFCGIGAVDQVDSMTRSMILDRTVPECTAFTAHVDALYWGPKQNAADPKKRRHCDFGFWRSTWAEGTWASEMLSPRPVVAAMGTVTREFAFVTNGAEIDPGYDGIRGAVFDRPNGRGVAAIWTCGMPVGVKTKLLVAATACDIFGNTWEVPAGNYETELTGTPLIFRFAAADRAKVVAALTAFEVTKRAESGDNLTIAVGQTLSAKPTVFSAPEAVYPGYMRNVEHGFFDKDRPMPRCEARFAWSKKGLKIKVDVLEKDYVPGIDTAEIAFVDSQVHVKGKVGFERYKFAPKVIKATRTTGSGRAACHEFDIPWTEIPGAKGVKGERLSFNLAVRCAAHAGDRKVAYSLDLVEPSERLPLNPGNFPKHVAFLQLQ